MADLTTRNTRGITEYLKGLAILAVFVNHFMNGFVTDSVVGYANGFIAVFFLLSGYGIYLSLERMSSNKDRNLLVRFATRRLVRIYPLFWVWCILHGFTNGWLGFFALDFYEPRSPWFIPAIVQCYIAAPFVFLVITRIGVVWSSVVFMALFIVLNGVLLPMGVDPVEAIGFRGLLSLHILLFALGGVIAAARLPRHVPLYVVILMTVVYLLLIHETSERPSLSNYLKSSNRC